jgi:hypothetical protein
MYPAMDLSTEELVHTEAYKLAKTRKSYNVLVTYEDPDTGEETAYVAKIRYFVVATLESEGKAVTVKYGVADWWALHSVQSPIGHYWESPAYPNAPDHPCLGVHVLDIQRKLLMDHPTVLRTVRVPGVRGAQLKAVKAAGRRWYEYGGKSREHRNRVDQAEQDGQLEQANHGVESAWN